MPEARDRLPRQEDGAEVFTRLRNNRSIGGLEILIDEPERGFGTPIRRGPIAMTGQLGLTAAQTGTVRRGRFGTPRVGTVRRGRSPATGQENTPMVGTGRRARLGRGRNSNSVLPIWYPRTPLQDVTAVVRAIERRGTRLRGTEGLEIGSPIVPQAEGHIAHTPGILRSGAQLEHEFSHTPKPTIGRRQCPPSAVGKVPKILLDITNQNTGESEFLTPQKKLLNSIDEVEKVVMEELRKLKRTPTARKAEREKRVRTLMSMR